MALVPGSLPMCPSPWNGAEAVQSPSRRSDFQLSPTLGGRATPSTAGTSDNQWPESFPTSGAVPGCRVSWSMSFLMGCSRFGDGPRRVVPGGAVPVPCERLDFQYEAGSSGSSPVTGT